MVRGHLGFIRDGEKEWRLGNEAGSGARRKIEKITPVYLSELNAKWGEDPVSVSNVAKQKSRGSADSRVTIWPDAEMFRKDGDAQKLGPDEFGYDSDVASNWSRGEAGIKLEEFDWEVLERQMRGPEMGTGFGDSRLKPIAQMPAYMPQRRVKTIDDQSS
jgi:hypothetical protein